MRIKLSAIFSVLVFAFYPVLLLFLFHYYGYYNYNDLEYNQFSIDLIFVMSLSLFSASYFSFLFFRRKSLPSDLFIFFHGAIILIPYAALHQIRLRNNEHYLLDLVTLATPVFLIIALRRVVVNLPAISIASDKGLKVLLVFTSIVVLFFLFLTPPTTASFDFKSQYVRRLEARETYGSGTLIAYFSSMVMNGVLPFLAYLAARRKSWIFLIVPIFLFLLFYYLYGVKAPLLYIAIGYMFGLFSFPRYLNKFLFLCSLGLISVLIFAVFEIQFRGYSYLEVYLIRRVFYAGQYLNATYFDFFQSYDVNFFTGMRKGIEATMYVGENILGHAGANANTNTFTHYLVQNGILGYLFAVFGVSIVFTLFDNLSKKNTHFYFVSFLFGILILEQSFTTSLLSSGIILIAILSYITKPSDYTHSNDNHR
ncbi:MAG: hypothetical protein LDLANPLL_01645 [Turneriella sp.]|nr:hypothetical protein [Turneriella sp.]